MNSSQDHEVSINKALFKRYRFYQLFDPDGLKLFDYNVYRLASVALATVVLAVMVYSSLSYFTDTGNTVDTIDALLIMFIYVVNAITFLKMVVFLRNPNVVWDLIDFTRLDFLTSSQCCENVGALCEYRDTSIKITDFFMNYTSVVLMTWLAVPLMYNAFVVQSTDDLDLERYQNVFNLKYPVTAVVFNRFYCVYYTMEVAIGIFLLYYSVLIDNFLISICFTAIGLYEVIGMAFASIGHNVHESSSHGNSDVFKNNSLNAYKDLKSIMYDQIQVYKKLKSLYSMIWIIVVSLIFVNSIIIIIFTYSFIVILKSAESFEVSRLIKLPSGYFCFAFQIFLYCYLFGKLNEKKESITFGMYSSDWTKMDLKSKKLLLLAMRMNNANNLNMKTSPTNIVNIQLFSRVMSTTYNIVTVMVNQTTKNVKRANS